MKIIVVVAVMPRTAITARSKTPPYCRSRGLVFHQRATRAITHLAARPTSIIASLEH